MLNATTSSLLKSTHTRQKITATCRYNKFHHLNGKILVKIFSPWQNFVAATCRTDSNWSDLRLCDLSQRHIRNVMLIMNSYDLIVTGLCARSDQFQRCGDLPCCRFLLCCIAGTFPFRRDINHLKHLFTIRLKQAHHGRVRLWIPLHKH